jgi:hypothetical protein
MKTFVHSDAAGGIHAFITVDAPDGVTIMLEPEPGLMVAEVDGPELVPATDDVEKLREIAQNYVVATPSLPRSRLTRSHPGS